MAMPFPEAKARALFELADIEVTSIYRLENDYWPDAYEDARRASPWWLAITPYGPIRIGWRKRVISIAWKDTPARLIVTEDQTTKDEDMVHAWTYPKAVEYLGTLGAALRRPAAPAVVAEADLP